MLKSLIDKSCDQMFPANVGVNQAVNQPINNMWHLNLDTHAIDFKPKLKLITKLYENITQNRKYCNESASSAPSTALSPLTSREHDLTTRRADSAIIKKRLEVTGNIDEYSNTFDGNQEQRVGSRS
ncbi:hypothetical protein NQ317_001864 [Molorchus minor]|uniref:Uncharacterized protein n=1 Tax=Molorchus minor TaxID=1323400 RepID=A0ABQ9K0S9_9CUCU|nr:hypothetical protein NQ317_001864 [Molorchus minor]